jgi:hypothetical protein
MGFRKSIPTETGGPAHAMAKTQRRNVGRACFRSVFVVTLWRIPTMIGFRTIGGALALWGFAGVVAAQQGPGAALNPSQINAESAANAAIMNYRPDASAWSDQPPPWRGCVERQTKTAAAPRVVKTMPAPGSVVRPGPMVLSVTFDQPMACEANLAKGSPFPVPCPADKAAVVIASDQRTLTTVCQVEAGASYSMPIDGFISAKGAKADRYELQFTTSSGEPVRDARQALTMEKVGSVRR